MLIYTYTALIFGFIYGMGILYYNSRSNEQFYTFLNPSDEFIKTFINGLFVGFIFILIMLITAGTMPLLILEGAYKWIKKKEK